jgi:nucleotide-binding universal stress UspA family protein
MEATEPEVGRILCATHMSDKSAGTYRYAIQKANEDSANILVCHIISQRSIKVAKRLAYFLNETCKNIVKEKTSAARKRMQEQLRELFNNEFSDHPEYADCIEHLLVYHGKIAEELVEKANRFGCEAIVLGAQYNHFVKQFFPSITAKKIIKRTKKPIFMVSAKHGNIDITSYNE